MTSDTDANSRRAFRLLLTWILVVLVLANIAVWTAWPFKDRLVTLGILPPPPIERVDLDARPLPPIVERPEASADAHPRSEPLTSGDPETEGAERAEPAVSPEESPTAPPPAPEVAHQPSVPSVNGQPSSGLLDCVVVGPIGSREALEAMERRLLATGALVDSMAEPVNAPPEYVVYIEPALSLDAALVVLKQLEEQSIRDAAPMFSGSDEVDEVTVSVGVYRSRGRADARRDRITALGHTVKVRERESTAYRLHVRDVSAEALADLAYEPCGESEAR